MTVWALEPGIIYSSGYWRGFAGSHMRVSTSITYQWSCGCSFWPLWYWHELGVICTVGRLYSFTFPTLANLYSAILLCLLGLRDSLALVCKVALHLAGIGQAS